MLSEDIQKSATAIIFSITSLPAGLRFSHAGIVFTQWSKNRFFAPQERHVAPINVKFGTGQQTESGQKFGNTVPPKLSKFQILAINLCLRGDLFALFLRNSQLLYASIGSF